MQPPGLNILVVEHDPASDSDLGRKLAGSPFVRRVNHVASAADAISYLSGQGEYADRRAHPDPSLVVIDLGLPEALRLLSWIRERPGLPVVAVAPSRESLNLGRAREMGAHSCLVRPFPPGDLTSILEAAHRRQSARGDA